MNIDVKYLKTELKKHTSKNRSTASNGFDSSFLDSFEENNGLRVIGLNKCGKDLNVLAYQKLNGSSVTTKTIKLKNFLDHDTTARFALYICDFIEQRAKADPSELSDSLTSRAVTAIGDKNQVYRTINTVRTQLNQYLS